MRPLYSVLSITAYPLSVKRTNRKGESSEKVLRIENLGHFSLQAVLHFLSIPPVELLGRGPEKVVVQLEVLENHLRVKEVLLGDIDVDLIVPLLDIFSDELLDGMDIVVNEELLPLNVPSEAAHPVVQEDDFRVEGLDQVVQGCQGRNLPAGGDVDVDSEGGNATRFVSLRIRVGADVAFVQMGQTDAALCLVCHRTLGDEDRYARTHWVVVLSRDVEDAGANDLCHALEDALQSLRVVHLVDVGEIFIAVRPALGVADVVYVETQALGQVIEATEPEFLFTYSHAALLRRSTRLVLRSYTPWPAVAKPSLE